MLRLQQLVRQSQQQLYPYFEQRRRETLLRKRFCDLEDFELYEVTILAKSLRERIKYGIKDTKKKNIDAKGKLAKE